MRPDKILRVDFSGGEWCVPGICPCLTCELWLNDDLDPDCCCLPCRKKGLRRPQDIICWKTNEALRVFDKKMMAFIPSRAELSERGLKLKGQR